MNRNGLRNTFYYYLPLFFWSVLIFLLSQIPGNGKANYDIWFILERKGAHIIEYAVLAILWARVIFLKSKNQSGYFYFWAILAPLVYAVSDEVHQLFVFGRSGKASDVAVDLLGILLGISLYCYFKKSKNKKSICN